MGGFLNTAERCNPWRRFTRTALAAFTCVLLFSPSNASAQRPGSPAQPATVGSQLLAGHLRPEFAAAPLVGPLESNATLYLAIGLPLSNEAGLDTQLQEIYDPKSPQFQHFLTPTQFAAQYGGSTQDYDAVIAFAAAHGLTVDARFSSRLLLSVSAPAAQVNAAFHILMQKRKRPDGTIFYAPDREPSINLGARILYISGLDNYTLPRHTEMLSLPHSLHMALTGSGPNGRLGGSDFRNVYAPGISQRGAGQSVGLFELDGFYTHDIALYRAAAANELTLNAPVSVAATLNGFVNGSTQSGPPKGGCRSNPTPKGPAGTPLGENGEVALDIDMAMAMAPNLDHIFVYEGCNPDAILSAMAAEGPNGSRPKQLSASWTFSTTPNTAGIAKQMAASGQTLLLIAGDKHATCPDGNISSIRALPYATVVGGTILTTTSNGAAWKAEIGAKDGGAILNGVPLLSYQTYAAANVNDATARAIPDVAMASCDGSHHQCSILSYSNNGSGEYTYGTSAAAPLFAGYIALANETRAQQGLGPLGFLNPTLYSIYADPAEYARDFHDITSGASPPNPCPTGVPTSAKVGYDLITGLGSPTAKLIPDLLPPTPPVCQATTGCPGNVNISCTGPDIGIAFNGNCHLNSSASGSCTAGYTGASTATDPGNWTGSIDLDNTFRACTRSSGKSICTDNIAPNTCSYGSSAPAQKCAGYPDLKWCAKYNRCVPLGFECQYQDMKPPPPTPQ